MKNFFNIKKTKNIILWIGIFLGLFIGLFAILENNIISAIFWLGISFLCLYTLRQKSKLNN